MCVKVTVVVLDVMMSLVTIFTTADVQYCYGRVDISRIIISCSTRSFRVILSMMLMLMRHPEGGVRHPKPGSGLGRQGSLDKDRGVVQMMMCCLLVENVKRSKGILPNPGDVRFERRPKSGETVRVLF